MLDTYLLTIFGPLRGTHDSIESHAFASLTTGEQKNLPRFTSIRIFSGPLGPDTLWLLGRYGADRSRYDPLTIFGPLRGTHDSIESHAFASLTTGEQKNLPRFTSIRIFSGPLGPDTLWLLGRYGADRSRYDPIGAVA